MQEHLSITVEEKSLKIGKDGSIRSHKNYYRFINEHDRYKKHEFQYVLLKIKHTYGAS